MKCLDILGIVYPNISLSDDDKEIYKEWINAKNEKNFEKADKLRNVLIDKGIL